jgi:molybdopterin-guanine dinucleotide biosynthesis protein MobB
MYKLPFTPTISFVGHSGSGKTTLIELLLPELSSRGYRVSVAKHIGENIDIDTPGKDTWRFSRAGAHSVIISTDNRSAVIGSRFQKNTLDELRHAAGPSCDLLLVEGHKRERGLKFEVRRSPESRPLAVIPELVAIISAFPWEEKVPCFAPSDISGIANLIEQRFLKPRRPSLALFVDGRPCQIERSVNDKLVRMARSLITAANGAPGPRHVELWLRLKNRGD